MNGKSPRLTGIWPLLIFILMTVTPAMAGETSLWLIGPEGEIISGGQTHDIKEGDAVFTAQYLTQLGGEHLVVDVVAPDDSFSWHLAFEGLYPSPLEVGSYYGATRFPFNAANEPGLDVSGNNRACGEISGEFHVQELELGLANEVIAFFATFTQFCESSPLPLNGIIKINAAQSSPVSELSWSTTKTLY